MLVYGGLDKADCFLSCVYLLDLVNYSWNKAEIKGSYKGVAYHSSTLVLSREKKEHPNLHIYRFPELPNAKNTNNSVRKKLIEDKI